MKGQLEEWETDGLTASDKDDLSFEGRDIRSWIMHVLFVDKKSDHCFECTKCVG